MALGQGSLIAAFIGESDRINAEAKRRAKCKVIYLHKMNLSVERIARKVGITTDAVSAILKDEGYLEYV